MGILEYIIVERVATEGVGRGTVKRIECSQFTGGNQQIALKLDLHTQHPTPTLSYLDENDYYLTIKMPSIRVGSLNTVSGHLLSDQ